MLYPSLDSMIKYVDSKYTLVVAAAKRARQLVDGDEKMVDVKTNKPVSIALFEINEGKISYKRTKTGIK
ncbi:MAG: DNA-directed polymerase subunit omega [Thermosediminibacterales bacterium]|nr:DNA-directed polymerase subunit omega [Thermosediminibacterales bacterium]MDK2836066.1 DNA-directed polymerase subunit omega [Thermosediminibacterales bacterium]